MPRDKEIDRDADRESLAMGKPFIRSAVALALYLRFGTPHLSTSPNVATYNIGRAHDDAEEFVRVLDEDLAS